MNQQILRDWPDERKAMDIAWTSTCPRCGAKGGWPCRKASGKETHDLHVGRREIGLRAVYDRQPTEEEK